VPSVDPGERSVHSRPQAHVTYGTRPAERLTEVTAAGAR